MIVSDLRLKFNGQSFVQLFSGSVRNLSLNFASISMFEPHKALVEFLILFCFIYFLGIDRFSGENFHFTLNSFQSTFGPL